MTPLVRNCHRLAVAVHLCGLAVFAYAYSVERTGHGLGGVLWCQVAGSASEEAMSIESILTAVAIVSIVVFGVGAVAYWVAGREFGRDRGGE